METTDKLTNGAAPRKRVPLISNDRRLKKLALDAIIGMIRDDELKPSDRLNAAKTLLDYLGKQTEADGDGELHIVFENLPDGFAD
ncbi:MAG: hypothetical protein J5544_05955 [Clostridia bacterium]|nr:hypothetical protein [Clostridia bacterium]